MGKRARKRARSPVELRYELDLSSIGAGEGVVAALSWASFVTLKRSAPLQSGEIASSLINHPVCGGRGREGGALVTHDHRTRPCRNRARKNPAPVESGCAVRIYDVPLKTLVRPVEGTRKIFCNKDGEDQIRTGLANVSDDIAVIPIPACWPWPVGLSAARQCEGCHRNRQR